MTFTGRYEVTRELQDDMTRQYYFRVLLRPRVDIIVACLVVTGCLVYLGGLVRDLPFFAWIYGFICALAFVAVLAWVRAFFALRAQGRAGFKLMEHPRVEVTFDEHQVIYASSTGTRQYSWTKIDRVTETRDFIVLMAGKIPLLILPKSCFSAEALAFLLTRAAEPPAARSS
jgi:hypothetical protein